MKIKNKKLNDFKKVLHEGMLENFKNENKRKRIKMKEILDFICEQGLELNRYPTLIKPLKEKFEIKNYNGNQATEELITAVMFWEKHTEISDSLEKFLNDRFIVNIL